MNISIHFLKFNCCSSGQKLVKSSHPLWVLSIFYGVFSSWQSLSFLGHIEATWEKMKEMQLIPVSTKTD